MTLFIISITCIVIAMAAAGEIWITALIEHVTDTDQ